MVLLRHEETLWNKENRFTGWTDVDLSDYGNEEGGKAGGILKEHGITFDIDAGAKGLAGHPGEKITEGLDGLGDPLQETMMDVADATVRCLLSTVPAAVPGVAFLSGGQAAEPASARLNAMNVRLKLQPPWALSFSFGRAIQQPALEIWQGKDANVSAAQQALAHRARCNRAACCGEYTAAMERA